MVVGLGAGTQKVRVRAQVYQLTESGRLQQIEQGVAEAYGDSMPGMAVPVGVGAAAGRAASAAVLSGGMNVVSEISGSMDRDLDRLAEEVGKAAEDYYRRQGWL